MFIVPVISGKGGVGKSTVAVNLAVSLVKTGAKVGLVDCDFYGPSVPTLLGGGDIHPDSEGRIMPAERFGLKYISIAFFLREKDDAVIWRGPMLHKAITQMFSDVNWGPLDFLVVDMPPGTGDAQLSLSQTQTLSGAIVVTTPQEVALADVRKAISMLKKINVPVLGIVENMSGFLTPDGKSYDIFGSGGGADLALSEGVPLLAKLPLEMSIREGGDNGIPAACDEKLPIGKAFYDLALKLKDILANTKGAVPSLKILQ